ncbi:beta strand repeat-containing protein [Roseovarius nanhaiticus]|uniref:beta strand repeat-containing protein n=1 Tax=Roseovarius nanhaiticus TaxID=573024 RepID=UPI0024924FAE|nr:DUF4214 domain-containing protein [Roseovarius nanhaiticus]
MATQAQINFVTSLYVGYFDRAPDPAGLQFWINSIDAGVDVNTIAGNFAASGEAQAIYPFLATPGLVTPASFVGSIYLNLFNRPAETAGLNYWVDLLNSGAISPADMIEEIIGGAQGSDKTILDNKVEAGRYFVEQAATTPGYSFDAAEAKAAIDGVTADPASVTAAKAATDAAVSGGGTVGTTFTLTTTVGEDIVGTDAADVINGTVDAAGLGATPPATLNTTDSVDGGAGTDTANISSTSVAAAVPAGAVKNVEIVNLISDTPTDTFAAGAAAVGNFAGVQQLWQIGGTASQAVTGQTDAVTVGFNATAVNQSTMATGATTANFALVNATAGGTLNVNEATAGTLTTVNVNGSVAGNGALTVDTDAAGAGAAASAETDLNLNLSSNGTITVTSSSLTTVDASASTGNLTIAAPATTTTLKGGSGNDNLTGGGASQLIEGATGNDNITAGNVAGEVINGGANGSTANAAAALGSEPAGLLADVIDLGAGGNAQDVLIEAGHSGLTANTSDNIINFVSGEDDLDFNLAAGSATNFLNGGSSSSYTDGLTNANTAFDGTVQYFATNDGTDTFVFVDSDLDGTADMGVTLQGIAAVVAGDFVA